MTTPNSAPLRTGGIAASREYAELPAWQKAMALAEQAYRLTEDFPAREHRGLGAELRAAAARIATHIAAGSGKPNEQGILNSYFDAQAACAELATMAMLAERLGYIEAEAASGFAEENQAVVRLLMGMRHGLKVEAKDEKRAAREVAERDREYAQRSERAARKPRRDFDAPRGERPDREERQYKPRGEFKPRREYGDKPRGDREDRPYKPRGEFKPRGDRPARKPYRKD